MVAVMAASTAERSVGGTVERSAASMAAEMAVLMVELLGY
jgi:hypothetical protein